MFSEEISAACGKLKFRGVQLDLARQPETLDYIREFLDFTGKYGYTHLILYLEGRVRTKSFPYRTDDNSYSENDIRQITDYADGKKIQVVPVVSVLGHAELFLSCPELGHLAELRGGMMGRHSTKKQVFCPSQKETFAFLEAYLSEVSELFPSEYFHAGFDEAWDIGYCDLCRKRLESETQADIFGEYLLKSYDIISRKLGKRMIIWDDMFDIYPEAVYRLPRDVIMCSWHYDDFIDRPAGHCGGPKTDKFAFYDKLGFEYIFAPAASYIRNVESFTEYASKRNPAGGLLTVWELERSFLHSAYPVISYAGELWNGKGSEDLQEKAVAGITGCRKDEEIAVIRNLLLSREITLPLNIQGYLKGPLTNAEYERKLFLAAAGSILEEAAARAGEGLEFDVLEDMAIRVQTESVFYDLRETLSALYDPEKSGRRGRESQKSLNECASTIESLKKKRRRQWDRFRPGIKPCGSDDYLNAAIGMLAPVLEDSAKVSGLLKVKFPFNGSAVDYYIKYRGSEKWEKAGSRVAKSMHAGEFENYFPLYDCGSPEAVKLDSGGYVGTAVGYLQIETKAGRFVPSSFSGISGVVSNPENLLEDGRDWCFMGEGEQAARRKFLNPCLAEAKNSITVHLDREEFNGAHDSSAGE